LIRTAADNDILYKASWYGLVRELLSAIPSEPKETLVLGHARFVVGKRLERQGKKGLANAAKALAHLNDVLQELTQAEPSAEEQSFAARLENIAQDAGVALDPGESLLCAIVVHRGLDRLATGDKRAICALEVISRRVEEVRQIPGRVVCLEQMFLRLLGRQSPEAIRAAVCGEPHVDRALTACFACSSPTVGPEDWLAGLTSYIQALRAEAPTLLDS